MEIQVSEKGGFANYLQALMEEKDQKKIYHMFKEIVLMSYGQKSADGRTFIKRKMIDGQMVRLRDEFEQTDAFSELMIELISGGDKTIAEFINKLIPKELADEVAKQQANGTIPMSISSVQ